MSPPSTNRCLDCVAIVTDTAGVDAAGGSRRRSGGIDVVVANAGIGAQGTVADNDDEEGGAAFDVNVLGVSRTVAPPCRSCAGPRLLPWSTASIVPWAGLPAGALRGVEGGVGGADAGDGRRPRPRGDPRQCRPRDRRHAVGRAPARRHRRSGGRARRSKRQPLGRMVSPEEVAWAICYLARRGRRRRRGRSWPSTAGCTLRLRPSG